MGDLRAEDLSQPTVLRFCGIRALRAQLISCEGNVPDSSNRVDGMKGAFKIVYFTYLTTSLHLNKVAMVKISLTSKARVFLFHDAY